MLRLYAGRQTARDRDEAVVEHRIDHRAVKAHRGVVTPAQRCIR